MIPGRAEILDVVDACGIIGGSDHDQDVAGEVRSIRHARVVGDGVHPFRARRGEHVGRRTLLDLGREAVGWAEAEPYLDAFLLLVRRLRSA